MQQPTQDVASLNNTILTVPRVRDRGLLAQALMRSCLIVEGGVFDQHTGRWHSLRMSR